LWEFGEYSAVARAGGLKAEVPVFARARGIAVSTFRGWLRRSKRAKVEDETVVWLKEELKKRDVSVKDVFKYVQECHPMKLTNKRYGHRVQVARRLLQKAKDEVEGYVEIKKNVYVNVNAVKSGARDNFPFSKAVRVEKFETKEKGKGVRALEDIREGRFILEYVGEVIDEATRAAREERGGGTYFMSLEGNLFIDTERKGNVARYVNHDCNPNAFAELRRLNGLPRVILRAKRKIEAGEEITIHYGKEYKEKRLKECKCSKCFGHIRLSCNTLQIGS
jgi:hypothetical protein